jgi:hypothetical protein
MNMFKPCRILLLLSLALTAVRLAAAEASGYFPPPECQGGWRTPEKPEDIRRLAGMDPDKLASLKQWLLDSDKRDFAAVVIRHGLDLVVTRQTGSSGDWAFEEYLRRACQAVLSSTTDSE